MTAYDISMLLACRSRQSLRFLTITLTLGLGITTSAQTNDASRQDLVNGIDAFKAGNYSEAASQFRAALDADPGSNLARLYLGTTYCYQVVANDDSPANLALGEKAIDLFKKIPSTAPEYTGALKQLTALYRNIKRFDDARNTEIQILDLNPADAESHYTIAVIDWTQAYKFAASTLDAAGLGAGLGDTKMPLAICDALRAHNLSLVDDAILHLEKAVDLQRDYADAMEYLNLAYSSRADFDCNNPAARKQDIEHANEWVIKSVAIRKQQAQTKQQQNNSSAFPVNPPTPPPVPPPPPPQIQTTPK
jgi:tetratricopeptide (TPR) repeat protein